MTPLVFVKKMLILQYFKKMLTLIKLNVGYLNYAYENEGRHNKLY